MNELLVAFSYHQERCIQLRAVLKLRFPYAEHGFNLATYKLHFVYLRTKTNKYLVISVIMLFEPRDGA